MAFSPPTVSGGKLWKEFFEIWKGSRRSEIEQEQAHLFFLSGGGLTDNGILPSKINAVPWTLTDFALFYDNPEYQRALGSYLTDFRSKNPDDKFPLWETIVDEVQDHVYLPNLMPYALALRQADRTEWSFEAHVVSFILRLISYHDHLDLGTDATRDDFQRRQAAYAKSMGRNNPIYGPWGPSDKWIAAFILFRRLVYEDGLYLEKTFPGQNKGTCISIARQKRAREEDVDTNDQAKRTKTEQETQDKTAEPKKDGNAPITPDPNKESSQKTKVQARPTERLLSFAEANAMYVEKETWEMNWRKVNPEVEGIRKEYPFYYNNHEEITKQFYADLNGKQRDNQLVFGSLPTRPFNYNPPSGNQLTFKDMGKAGFFEPFYQRGTLEKAKAEQDAKAKADQDAKNKAKEEKAKADKAKTDKAKADQDAKNKAKEKDKAQVKTTTNISKPIFEFSDEDESDDSERNQPVRLPSTRAFSKRRRAEAKERHAIEDLAKSGEDSDSPLKPAPRPPPGVTEDNPGVTKPIFEFSDEDDSDDSERNKPVMLPSTRAFSKRRRAEAKERHAIEDQAKSGEDSDSPLKPAPRPPPGFETEDIRMSSSAIHLSTEDGHFWKTGPTTSV
ncbi:hypothetical protein F4819DRAFT_508484 [Hypoxylon fuscum]|nr:hypothetical protein F4819DRAFT_508484 [Hypoxylon fuscum]